MTRQEMIDAIEDEMARLKQVRELLGSSASERLTTVVDGVASATKKPRTMSVEARRSIAQAQKRRWAKQHKENASAASEVK